MVPILSIVGWSNSGKTTFITKLIPKLKDKGYKVATIKHNAHKFEVDKPGKDSWLHRQAGAETVILSSQEKVAVIKEVEDEVPVEELVTRYVDRDFDIIIVEGYKTGTTPKIEIFRPKLYEEPVATEELLARIINDETGLESLFVEQLEEVVRLIEEEIIK